ncbi:uncharacterized protein LOC105781534 [Gossypium raimondii]|uniref:uncharacterized protein LOC105781534 n=1 Tax=Gossypium raimondii TaxID=29730 RepID=UPI00063AD192|nr:uncharacterized protein LOC105781534 [Gossypium raimondii]
MEDITIVKKILRSITLKFDYVVCAIEESEDIDELYLASKEQALKAFTVISSSNFRERGKGRCIGRGRGDRGSRDGENKNDSRNYIINDDQSKGKGQDFDKSKIKCFRCQKFDHCRFECYARLPSDKDEQSNLLRTRKERPCWWRFKLKRNLNQVLALVIALLWDVMGKGNINISTKNGFVETISNVLFPPISKANC